MSKTTQDTGEDRTLAETEDTIERTLLVEYTDQCRSTPLPSFVIDSIAILLSMPPSTIPLTQRRGIHKDTIAIIGQDGEEVGDLSSKDGTGSTIPV